MKPDWDRLMTEFADSTKVGVYDVDCTTAGKPLCDSNGVKGFPSIKYGDASNLEDYSGGRDYAALAKFASELKPLCSPSNMDLCDDEQKAKIVEVQAMSAEELDAAIVAADKKAADAETTFSEALEKLQATYKQLQEDKEATLAEVKASGVGLLKAVKASKSAAHVEL
jgi:hypothetical protein